MSATSPKPTSKSSEPTFDSVLGRGALLYEGVHARAAFIVREAARDHARGEVLGTGRSEVHLMIEGALARGEGFRRLFRKLFGKAHDFRVESIWGNDTVHKAPFQRFLRIDSVSGQEQLHGALAQQVAAHRDTGGRAEKAPADSRGGELRRLRGDRQVALRDELAARRGRRALHPRDHRLRQRADRLHHPPAILEKHFDLWLVL